jgi:hypothetical protein
MDSGSAGPNPPQNAGVEFLRAELHTGLTFATIALQATYKDKIDRNRINARKAYDSLLHYISKTALDSETALVIEVKLEELRFKLHELGEQL